MMQFIQGLNEDRSSFYFVPFVLKNIVNNVQHTVNSYALSLNMDILKIQIIGPRIRTFDVTKDIVIVL